MYELVQVSERCYYINCPAKIGIYVSEGNHVYLIDSGSDKDAGRKVRQLLDKNGWHLAAIPMRTTSAATSTFRDRPDVGFTAAALRRPLQNIRCWSLPSSTAAFHAKTFATSS